MSALNIRRIVPASGPRCGTELHLSACADQSASCSASNSGSRRREGEAMTEAGGSSPVAAHPEDAPIRASCPLNRGSHLYGR